jgi:acetyltransferase-like isoleucine patch superfamily enzyme
MNAMHGESNIQKEAVLKKLSGTQESAFKKYHDFFIGKQGVWNFLVYELAATVLAPMTGAAGLFLRKLMFPALFKKVGSGVVWGRDLSLRHPAFIQVGDRTGIDDNCMLDARGGGEQGLQIGADVLIARDTIIQCKTGPISIGDRCTIGSQTQLSSVSGIHLGQAVMVGGQCYLGGGRYHIEDRKTPMMDQGLYSKGPVVIEDDVWIGAGVTILDGARIGRGSVIGSGAVIRENIPPFSVVTPYQKLVMLPRGESGEE